MASLLTLVIAGWMTFGSSAESTAAPAVTPTAPSEGSAGLPFEGGITSDDYVIQVDDILTIDGHQYAELTPLRTYTVAKDGTIKLVYIGRVKAAGLTKRALEEQLEEQYKDYFKNLVIDATVRSKTYTVVGEVRSPGMQPLQLKTTILTALARAGWFTDFGDQSEVIVIRSSGAEPSHHGVDCKAILRGKAEDFIIEPNDVIYVLRKGIF